VLQPTVRSRDWPVEVNPDTPVPTGRSGDIYQHRVTAPPFLVNADGPEGSRLRRNGMGLLIKYVPVEVLAAYLLMAGVIDSNVTGKRDLSIWLGGLLVGVLLLSVPYVRQVLKVVRWSQIGMSLVGLTVYIFALGGWFATTTWYHQWYASIVVPVFALLIAILKLPPLPPDPNG
jgi:hypothetical protein